ncbi:MAG: MFS transporter [Clostridiales bacterium]|nr:MFS transporter [Clostridiales bacterium]
MSKGPLNTFRLESIFAGMHSSYWMTMCTFSGFMAVYLSYYGFSDALVGLTASTISLITIAFQLFISSFSDANEKVPLKRILIIIYLFMLGLVTVLALIPMPILLMLVVYALTGGLGSSLPGLYNAQIIQFVNAGVPVNLGWPRGVSALVYAIFAYLLGLLLESYSASILMPICLICIVVAIIMVLIMPRPEQVSDSGAIAFLAEPVPKTSLLQLLKASRVVQLFLLSAVFMSAGSSNNMLFLPRVIESRGGTEAALGLAMFLQAGVEMPAMFLSPWLIRRFRARAILAFSLTAYFTKSLLIALSGSITGIYAAMVLSIFCFGLYGITSIYFINDAVRQNEKVRAQALVTASGALSAILSNSAAGWVVQTYGIDRLNIICVFLQAIALILMYSCAYLHSRDEKKKQPPQGTLPLSI